MRSPTRTLAASTLVFEALVVLFAGLVAKDLSSLSTGAALGLAGGLAAACVLTAGLLRTRAGYVVGSVLQVAVIGAGVWVPAMWVLGAVFAALWFVSLRVGRRIEREQAEHQQAEREHAEREHAEREHAEREHAEREQTEGEQAERQQADREHGERSV